MNTVFERERHLNGVPNIIQPSEVLFVTECSTWGEIGFDAARAAFKSVQPVFWSNGMPKPDLSGWKGDWIISFKADLILSNATLQNANKGAINFHPSPPKYRGLGGYWWALKNGDKTFGVTSHFMDERIDHGQIIKTEDFAIWPNETVDSLKHRAAVHALSLLNGTLDTIVAGKPVETCRAEWGEHLYTQKELDLAQRAYALEALRDIQSEIIGTNEVARSERIAKSTLALG